jgi:hypothetical protein
MGVKLIPICDGCGKEAEEIDMSMEEFECYHADDLANDLETNSIGDETDWGVFWNDEDEENKIYCLTCKAYKIR